MGRYRRSCSGALSAWVLCPAKPVDRLLRPPCWRLTDCRRTQPPTPTPQLPTEARRVAPPGGSLPGRHRGRPGGWVPGVPAALRTQIVEKHGHGHVSRCAPPLDPLHAFRSSSTACPYPYLPYVPLRGSRSPRHQSPEPSTLTPPSPPPPPPSLASPSPSPSAHPTPDRSAPWRPRCSRRWTPT
jgi:hypothetical protein